MPKPDFWTRLRGARIFPVLVVYVAASWGVLVLVNALQDALGLPQWMDPVASVLLLVGLVMISATAWGLSHPQVRERKEAGDLPGDWAVAPGTLVGDLVVGRVPHLTWGRSILGGVFALGLMFALAASVAFLAGTSGTGEPGGQHQAEEPADPPASGESHRGPAPRGAPADTTPGEGPVDSAPWVDGPPSL